MRVLGQKKTGRGGAPNAPPPTCLGLKHFPRGKKKIFSYPKYLYAIN